LTFFFPLKYSQKCVYALRESLILSISSYIFSIFFSKLGFLFIRSENFRSMICNFIFWRCYSCFFTSSGDTSLPLIFISILILAIYPSVSCWFFDLFLLSLIFYPLPPYVWCYLLWNLPSPVSYLLFLQSLISLIFSILYW